MANEISGEVYSNFAVCSVAGDVNRVCFLDLFTGTTNPIMLSLSRRIEPFFFLFLFLVAIQSRRAN